MDSLAAMDRDNPDESAGETRNRLIHEHQVEIFLRLDQVGARRAQVCRERAMKGGVLRAAYYLIAALVFLLFGAVF